MMFEADASTKVEVYAKSESTNSVESERFGSKVGVFIFDDFTVVTATSLSVFCCCAGRFENWRAWAGLFISLATRVKHDLYLMATLFG